MTPRGLINLLTIREKIVRKKALRETSLAVRMAKAEKKDFTKWVTEG